ncbi:MAG: hypothetical protein ACI9KE_004863, partial [Polyangiales bacterium]
QQPPAQQQQQQQQQQPAQQPPANGWQQAPAQQPAQQPQGQQQGQQGWFNGQGERPPGQGGPAAIETPGQSGPSGTTDHSQVTFGVTFFGLDNLTLLEEGPANSAIRLRMPAIGVRYWVSESIGLDIGIGLGIVSEQQFNNCQVDLTGNCGPEAKTGGVDGGFGIRLHFGLPVALKTYEHFNILLTPEIGFQYGQATIYNPTTLPNEAPDALDISLSSIALDVGVKIGGELHFGFWGVPNLALQANIGLGLRYQSTTASNAVSLSNAGSIVDTTNSSLGVRTIADDLAGAIRILYYF